MLKIKSITISGMHKIGKETYTFDDVNYVVGPNGAGKSTILEAIQLALLGYIPSTGKQSSGVFKHANGRSIEVTLVMADNKGETVTLQRSWVNTGKSIVSDVKINPESVDIDSLLSNIELPIFNFNEFVGMTANKLKEWFLANMASSTAESFSWKAKLLEAISNVKLIDDNVVEDAVDDAECADATMDPISGGNYLNSRFKSQLSALKAEGTQLSNTLRSLVHYEDVDLSEYSLSDIDTRLSELRKLKEDYTRESMKVEANKQVNLEIAEMNLASSMDEDPIIIEARKRFHELSDSLDAAELKMVHIREESAEANSEKEDAIRALAKAEAFTGSSDVCPYSLEACPTAAEHAAANKKAVADAESALKSASAKVTKIKNALDKLNLELQTLKAQRSGQETIMNNQSNLYAKYEYLSGKLSSIDEAALNVDIKFVDEEIIRFEDLRGKVIANESYYNLKDKVSSDLDRVDQLTYILNTWISETAANSQTMTDLANLPFKGIAKDIDTILSEVFGEKDIVTEFNLEAKANSFSFGINRNGQYIPFDLLSSGEKCLFSISLMVSILNKGDNPIKLILVDDLLDHLDVSRFTTLIESLSKLSKSHGIQFIFAGVQACNSNDINVTELK